MELRASSWEINHYRICQCTKEIICHLQKYHYWICGKFELSLPDDNMDMSYPERAAVENNTDYWTRTLSSEDVHQYIPYVPSIMSR